MESSLSKKLKRTQDIFSLRSRSGLATPPELLEMLRQSAVDDRVEVFRSPTNIPIGYLAWASVTKESLLVIIKTRRMPPYDYEWREGHLKVIYDTVIMPNWDLIARRGLKKWLNKQRLVVFTRRDRLHIWSQFKGRRIRIIV